jgi:hypothetical protein
MKSGSQSGRLWSAYHATTLNITVVKNCLYGGRGADSRSRARDHGDSCSVIPWTSVIGGGGGAS